MSECKRWGESEFDELISAAVDGELESQESDVLDAHLKDCADCRSRLQAFRQLDCLAAMDDVAFLTPGPAAVAAIEKKVISRSRRMPAIRWWHTALAVAAVLFSTVSVSLLLRPEQSQPDSINQALTIMKVLNEQTEEDHEAMLRTLLSQLRALKLEAANSQLSPADSSLFEKKIEDAMDKIRRMGF